MKYVLVYLCIILLSYYIINNSLNYELFTNNESSIPKVIVSTYHDKSKIPSKVYENIKQYAPNYKHIIYNDEEIVLFLKKYFDSNVLNTFFTLDRGAHKADLFRYCYLYQYGGIYMDIKTKLIKDINLIFNKKNIDFYTVTSMYRGTIYQGVLASKPKNPLFLSLIEHMVSVPKPVKIYFEFTRDLYRKIKLYYKTDNIKNGYYKDPYNKYNLYLFQEKCSRNPIDCEDGLDKYNKCCYIYDNEEKIIKTRYSDYPW